MPFNVGTLKLLGFPRTWNDNRSQSSIFLSLGYLLQKSLNKSPRYIGAEHMTGRDTLSAPNAGSHLLT